VANGRIDLDPAAAAAYDAVRHGQAEAAAFGPLGGKERLENAGSDCFGHAVARVAHVEVGKPGFLAWPGRDLDTTAVWHCVSSVEEQVEQHLAKLGRIDAHARQRGSVGQVDADFDGPT